MRLFDVCNSFKIDHSYRLMYKSVLIDEKFNVLLFIFSPKCGDVSFISRKNNYLWTYRWNIGKKKITWFIIQDVYAVFSCATRLCAWGGVSVILRAALHTHPTFDVIWFFFYSTYKLIQKLINHTCQAATNKNTHSPLWGGGVMFF